MKETITLYKQKNPAGGRVMINAVQLIGWITLATTTVEVEFEEANNRETMRKNIRAAIDSAKAQHKRDIEELENKLWEV